jgi:ATP phosphoribosyltransferase
VILRSEANLVASLQAPWGERARAAVRTVLTRIAAEEEARTSREVRAALDPGQAHAVEGALQGFEATLPYGLPSGAELVVHCRAGDAFAVVAALQGIGAQDITVRSFDYLFRSANPLSDRLFRRLA